MSKKSLIHLIYQAKNKNQKAQNELINMFWVDVFSFVKKKVHDDILADEITVNVFSKVLMKLDLFEPNFRFKTWILTIAQNTVIDYWRKKNREPKESTENLDEVKNIFAKSPEELLISEEENDEILQIVSSMESSHQDIIRLRFFEEKSIKVIANELNLSVSNTKVRIMRAKRVLAELLRNNKLHNE